MTALLFDEDDNSVLDSAEVDIVKTAIGQALALERAKRPNDNVQAVSANLIANFTPFRGRSKVHRALIWLRDQGQVEVSRRGVNPRVDEFSLKDGQ